MYINFNDGNEETLRLITEANGEVGRNREEKTAPLFLERHENETYERAKERVTKIFM